MNVMSEIRKKMYNIDTSCISTQVKGNLIKFIVLKSVEEWNNENKTPQSSL